MATKPPQAYTVVSYCWLCRNYHAVNDYWCPTRVVDRVGTWIFENDFELYLKVAIAAIMAGVLYVAIANLLGYPVPEPKPEPNPVMNSIMPIVGLVFVLTVIVYSLIALYGIMENNGYRPWARALGVFYAAMLLIGFPVIASLWRWF